MATAAPSSSPATPAAAASNWSSVVRKRAPPLAPPPAAAADRIVAGAGKSRQGIAVAVVDANAIIHGGDLLVSVADKVVSVAEVLAEVRDPVSRHRLSAVPFEVETMDPDPEALKNGENFFIIYFFMFIFIVCELMVVVVGFAIFVLKLLVKFETLYF